MPFETNTVKHGSAVHVDARHPHTTIIVFWNMLIDQDCPNPLTDSDAMGRILSLNRHHINYDPANVKAELNDPQSDAVQLSYYEHGRSLWMLADGPHPAGVEFEWDGVRCAGVWLPDEYLTIEAIGLTGEARREKMREWAKQACDVYSSWCNGECFGYDIKTYVLNVDQSDDPAEYEDGEVLAEDSCWGYIGMEYAEQSTEEAVESCVGSAWDRLTEDAAEIEQDNAY